MKNIAVIGSGISGLTSAYLLSQKHNVSVFEKNNYIGGHTATKDVTVDNQDYAIDTGFIVFNDKTYPNFLKLLDKIGIEKQCSEMSFSVHNQNTGLEYNGHNLDTLFAQRRNILNPKFWFLINQILKFNKLCKLAFNAQDYNEELTLGEFLTKHNFSEYFASHYILPMGAAIWSSSLAQMQKFQFKFFVQFFNNHGLLNIADRPQWYVIPNGSREYIKPLTKPFSDRIFLNSDITKVTRGTDGVDIYFSDNSKQRFDEVIFACHSDQALALLSEPTSDENTILSSMPYSANSVILHTDESILPKRKKAWASWNYRLSSDVNKSASVTYNMNILQGLSCKPVFCVTLNQKEAIDPAKVLAEFTYHHPVFNTNTINAQQQRHKICGVNNIHFTGAYWYNGFHEDGVRSAVDVAKRFDCHL